jgi:hypothetical protein
MRWHLTAPPPPAHFLPSNTLASPKKVVIPSTPYDAKGLFKA